MCLRHEIHVLSLEMMVISVWFIVFSVPSNRYVMACVAIRYH
jgi:hypothetical protein